MDLKKTLLLSVIFIVATAEYKSYKNYKVYKIVPNNENEVQILKEIQGNRDYYFWTDYVIKGSDVKIMVGPEKQNKFEEYCRSAGIKTKVAIDDVQRITDLQLKRPTTNRINNEYTWDHYQTLEEIYDWLNKTAEAHPNIAKPVVMGTSFEGREIRGLIINYKNQENPTIGMIEGGLHAREWISPAAVTWIIKEFLTSNDSEVRFMAENVVWHIFPVTNPDGYVYSFSNNRMWRKNRNTNYFTTCDDPFDEDYYDEYPHWGQDDDLSNGVDLNRNFDYLWMTSGASDDPCSLIFAGPSAASEPETRAIVSYVNHLQASGNLLYYFSVHSAVQWIMIPFSETMGESLLKADNFADMYEIAIRGAERLTAKHGTPYKVGTLQQILEGYAELSGSNIDWAKGVANIPLVYLFELRDDDVYSFLLPPEQIVPNNEEFMECLLEIDRTTRQIGYYTAGSATVVKSIVLIMAGTGFLAFIK